MIEKTSTWTMETEGTDMDEGKAKLWKGAREAEIHEAGVAGEQYLAAMPA